MFFYKELRFLNDIFKKAKVRTAVMTEDEIPNGSASFNLKENFGKLPIFRHFSKQTIDDISPKTMYKLTDALGLSFIFFLLPGTDVKTVFLIGPYQSSLPSRTQIFELGEKNGISPKEQKYFEQLFAAVPVLGNDNPLFLMLDRFCELIWNSPSFSIVDVNRGDSIADPSINRSLDNGGFEETLLNLKAMEMRYSFENDLIRAVSLGQIHMESRLFAAFSEDSFEKRLPDLLRNAKNYCIIMNTLLRKAAESGGVHPMYLDRLSSEFASKIEGMQNVSENRDKTKTQFFIPTNTKILYVFEIRVDNYDELYKNIGGNDLPGTDDTYTDAGVETVSEEPTVKLTAEEVFPEFVTPEEPPIVDAPEEPMPEEPKVQLTAAEVFPEIVAETAITEPIVKEATVAPAEEAPVEPAAEGTAVDVITEAPVEADTSIITDETPIEPIAEVAPIETEITEAPAEEISTEAAVEEVLIDENATDEAPEAMIPTVIEVTETDTSDAVGDNASTDEADDDEGNIEVYDENNNKLLIKCRRSCMANIIQSHNEEAKAYYSDLKNYILSFKGVKARMSWKYESFNKGRLQLLKLKIRGKTICLYCALDPNEFEVSKYFHEAVDAKTFAQVPMLVRVRSPRALKRAKKLINIIMERNGIVASAKFDEVDYVAAHPYERTQQLIDRGLIKILVPDGYIVVDPHHVISAAAASAMTAAEDEKPAGDLADINTDIDVLDAGDDESIETIEIYDENHHKLRIRCRRSCLSNIIQSENEGAKAYYSEIKNYILSHKGVKARMSWKYESFNLGRRQLLKLKIRGKTICLYFALDPSNFEVNKYFHEAVDSKTFSQVPMLVRVRSPRALKRAKKLIDMVMKENGVVTNPKFEPTDYVAAHPYESNTELVEKQLIKFVK